MGTVLLVYPWICDQYYPFLHPNTDSYYGIIIVLLFWGGCHMLSMDTNHTTVRHILTGLNTGILLFLYVFVTLLPYPATGFALLSLVGCIVQGWCHWNAVESRWQ